ncbi:YggS family pyridoxal phosphate-dependent enzyme [Pseudalkalibacillus salsuginis]|uniref:YggS family pyridoxal phosphate-dependent enzyme n=1 Tax=Pseudalkalibacillus salsuginis TaxID=2910972 RepID=UPI001F428470|nr:YggS family pyridoxal phosphate-dependent enzyme [Pseudalkalibacillus salsuginis]MCF6410486.1 YggS family pyridoxal phosphate-dependent enzyme [Pseudalkalibacillus salsuginis]
MSISKNLRQIKNDIAEACQNANRDHEKVSIIAVTKYVSVETAQEAVSAGIVHLGENRDDGFLHKYEQVNGDVQWHFIGTLQSRKVKSIIDKVDYIHSLDRMSLAKEINKRINRKIKCFVQVNVSGEDSKHGLNAEETIEFIKKVSQYENIEIVGLMTMAPFISDEERLRAIFRTMRLLKEEVQALGLSHAPCTELSMGMSNDYKIAVEEGATFIRIGTSLVGKEI